MNTLNLFRKRIKAAAMQLLAMVAALSGSLLSAITCLAANNALQFRGADDKDIGIRRGGLTMKALKTFGKRMNAAALMRLLAIIAALSGALLCASPCLAANNALDFDGVDDYVQLPNVLPVGSSHTIEMWVKVPIVGTHNLDAGERVGILLGNYDSSPNSAWEINANGLLRIWWNNGEKDIVGTKDLRDNQWHHIAFVRDTSADKFYAYIDGVSEIDHTGCGTSITFTAAQRIGRDNRASGSPHFHGGMDEVRVWNVARSQTEIQASMNYQLAGSETGLAAYYKFDEGTGTSLGDSKSGYNGTLTNGPAWTTAAAPAPMTPPGNALDFDGVDDYVQLPNVLPIGSSHTIEMWVKVPTVGTHNLDAGERVGILLGNYGSSPNSGCEIYSAGQLRIYWNGGEKNILGTKDLRDNQWHHIAFVRDTSADKFYAYIDGVSEIDHTGCGTSITFTAAQRIGWDYRGTPLYFHGEMDEVRIWNVARSQTQIQQDMYKTLSSGPVACYNFDQTSAVTVLTDLAGNNDGTLTNGPAWTPATWNYGFPYVTTGAVSSIEDTEASVAGTLVDEGTTTYAPVSASGICYGTSANPTTPCTAGGFPASLTGLTRATTYYARAYAENSAGRSYGSDVMFMTAPGNAFSFGGSSYVQLAAGTYPNINFSGSSDFTISMWFKGNGGGLYNQDAGAANMCEWILKAPATSGGTIDFSAGKSSVGWDTGGFASNQAVNTFLNFYYNHMIFKRIKLFSFAVFWQAIAANAMCIWFLGQLRLFRIRGHTVPSEKFSAEEFFGAETEKPSEESRPEKS